jgi:hypothetical protein
MRSSEKTVFAVATPLSLRQRAFRVLVGTQGLFFFALAWCVLLEHNHAAETSGISFYGVNHRTVILAIMGYVIAAVGLWRASWLFREGGFDPLLWIGLRCVAVMLILLLMTPYNAGTFFNWAHMSVGVVGALVQMAISISLLKRYGSIAAIAAFSVQLIGGILGAFSLPDWHFQILLIAETLFELGFGWCLLEWTKVLSNEVS